MRRSVVALLLALPLSGGAGSVQTAPPGGAKPPSALTAELNRAVERFDRGETEEAKRGFRRLIAAYNSGAAVSSGDLVAVGTACRYLGADDPQLFKEDRKSVV